ncbi:MAG TPA: MCE family protein [Amycolatopsis sp.]|uniref:MCE family protein n=1 Tax=Amycolatopsis sp. TaxID=37632 RepID=UPI002B49E429|nr:MCE family protein [Amycolatopsis sp.]HKS45928.1 MCE family protein [Amycolatopsis sp.]
MKSFGERNPVTIGVVGTLLLALAALATFNAEELPILGGGTVFQAEFGEAAGLQASDEVRVAGIKVGEVTKVELSVDHVQVSFRVNGAWIGNKTSAEIKIKTLLGRKFLALHPLGAAPQDPRVPIPRTRTVTPYDVTAAFEGLASTVGKIDTKQLAQSFQVLSDTFKNSPDYVRTALDGLSRLSTTIASRDRQLAELVGNTRRISETLAGSNTEFEKLLSDGNLLLAELNNRRDSIHTLLTGTQRLARQLSGIVADNRAQLSPALDKLNTVTDVLQRHTADLDRGLADAGPYFRMATNTMGNGRWIDSYICGLVETNRDPCTAPGGDGK